MSYDDVTGRHIDICLRCKNPLTIADLQAQIDSGSLHVNYCVNCVDECNTCHYEKSLFQFPYDPESKVYQKWVENGMIPFPPPSEAYGPTCNFCLRKQNVQRLLDAETAKRARLTTPAMDKLRAAMRARTSSVRPATVASVPETGETGTESCGPSEAAVTVTSAE